MLSDSRGSPHAQIRGWVFTEFTAFLIHAPRWCALYINLDRRQDRQGCWMLLVFWSFIFSFPLIPRNISSKFGTVHGHESQAKTHPRFHSFFTQCAQKNPVSKQRLQSLLDVSRPLLKHWTSLELLDSKPLHCRTPDEAFGKAEWSIGGTPWASSGWAGCISFWSLMISNSARTKTLPM